MTDDSDDVTWPPAMFTSQWQRASEEFTEKQLRLLEQMLSASPRPNSGRGANGLSDLGVMSTEAAVFKTRVQSGGRISIPDAEREALGIDEGDLVQAVVVPINNHGDNNGR